MDAPEAAAARSAIRTANVCWLFALGAAALVMVPGLTPEGVRYLMKQACI